MPRAITFDFWDTLVVDDSDEPKRAAKGLPDKPRAREELVVTELLRSRPHLEEHACVDAWAAANAWARKKWKVDFHNPTVSARVMHAFRALDLRPGRGFPELVERIEVMEVEIPPDFLEAVDATLAALGREHRLGIVSDAIVSPGRSLRRILADHDLLHHFDYTVFSDEIGFSKPHRAVFDAAAEGLGVAVSDLVHVGDREANDVAGPKAVGAKAVLFTGAIDRGHGPTTSADALCQSFADLPAIIGSLP